MRSSEESSEMSAASTCEQYTGFTGCQKGTSEKPGTMGTKCGGEKECQSLCCEVNYEVDCPMFQRLVGCPAGAAKVKNGDLTKKCLKGQCLALCCDGVARSCKDFLADHPCPAGSKPKDGDVGECDGSECESMCCVPDRPTCAKWFETTECLDIEERASDFFDITCSGEECAKSCCTEAETKTCSVFWKDQKCTKGTKEKATAVDAHCFGTRCQSVCCDEEVKEISCSVFLGDQRNKCLPGTVPIKEKLETRTCAGQNCKQLCCDGDAAVKQVKDCRGFFSHFPCQSGMSRMKGYESLPCEHGACPLTCCSRPPPMTCSRFTTGGKTGKCPKAYRPKDNLTEEQLKATCQTFIQCTKECCTDARRMICGDFFMNKGCPDGTQRKKAVDGEGCTEGECQTRCCEKTKCEVCEEEDKKQKSDDKFIQDLTESLSVEPEPCTDATCPQDPMKAINADKKYSQNVCVNCGYGTTEPVPQQRDLNALMP